MKNDFRNPVFFVLNITCDDRVRMRLPRTFLKRNFGCCKYQMCIEQALEEIHSIRKLRKMWQKRKAPPKVQEFDFETYCAHSGTRQNIGVQTHYQEIIRLNEKSYFFFKENSKEAEKRIVSMLVVGQLCTILKIAFKQNDRWPVYYTR